MPRPSAVVLVTGFVLATWWAFALNGSPRIGIDDANIFFSYAQNLAEGRGFTYASNPERVEGATSLLWTLICATVFTLHGTERAVLVVTMLLAIAAQLLLLDTIVRVTRRTRQSSAPAEGLFVALLLANPGYVTWMALSLMDTSLWGFVLAAMARVTLLPPQSRLGRTLAVMLFALAPLVRPEGMLVAPAMAGILLLRYRRASGVESSGSAGGSQRSAIAWVGVLVASAITVTVGLTLFRLAYFGYPVPNSFYAKVSPSLAYNLALGARYLLLFVSSGLVPIALVAAAVVYSLRRYIVGQRGQITPATAPHETAAFVALVLLATPVLTGGDHFASFRFYQPAYPLLCLPLVLWLAGLPWIDQFAAAGSVRNRAWFLPAVIAGFAIGGYGLYTVAFWSSWSALRNGRAPLAHEFRIAEEGRAAGRQLADFAGSLGRQPVVGVIASGGIALTYPGRIVDLLGLNDLTVSHFPGKRQGTKNHAAFEVDAFFQVEPDLLLMRPTPWNAEVVKGLFSDVRFVTRWSYGVLARPGHPEQSIQLFARRALMAELNAHGLEFREVP